MTHLCDTNIFIAVAVEQHTNHSLAASWFSGVENENSVAFCRATQTSFLRLLTRRIAPSYTPQSNRRAWEIYDLLFRDDAVVFAEEPARTEAEWGKLTDQATASPKNWMDAYLAAFAIAGGFRMTTLDSDFKKFERHGLDLLLLGS